MACNWGCFCQDFDICAKTSPLRRSNDMPFKISSSHNGTGQYTRHAPVAVSRQVIPQHNRILSEGRSKPRVVIELWLKCLQALGKCRVVLEFVIGQCIQATQARTFIGFCKDDVKANQGNFLLLKQDIQQISQLVATPGETANFSQALLVDVDDDDPIIH